jgi:hypothetical protein
VLEILGRIVGRSCWKFWETRDEELVAKETLGDPELKKQVRPSKDVSAVEKAETESNNSGTPVEAKDSASIVNEYAQGKEPEKKD